MSTFKTRKRGLLRKSICIFVIAAIACLATTSSSDAFQGAVPQSPKTAIANLRSEMQMLIDNIATIRQNANDNRDKIFDLRSRRETIFEKQDSLGISNESFGDVLKNLQGRRVELMIDLAGIEARRDSLTAIQETEIGSKSDSSSLELLKKLVELCAKKLDRANQRRNEGSVSSTEVNAAEIEYLNAKLKLTNAKNSVQVSPRVNEELLSVSLDRAEKRARLIKTEELLKTITESRKTLLENEDVSASIVTAKQKQESLEFQVEALEIQLRSMEQQLRNVMKDDE